MRHFIIVKFNNTINIQEISKQISDLFNNSLNIDGVENVEIYTSNTNLSNRYDLMIEMKLTQTALKIFDNSEIHKTWKNEYGKYITNKAIFDCN